jgi:hypothetical protein
MSLILNAIERSELPGMEFENGCALRAFSSARDAVRGETLREAAGNVSGMFLVFMWGENCFSRAISWITGGPSHCAVGFDRKKELPANDAKGREKEEEKIYFEALYGVGVRGPLPLSRVREWAKRDGRRAVAIVPVKVPEQMLNLKYAVALSYVGHSTYSVWQLLLMFAHIRWGWPVPFSRGLVCSEYAARVLFPDPWPSASFDEVTPADLWAWAKRRGDQPGAHTEEEIGI